ncbi:MAG TPA: hypothetical protein VKT32_01195 [Chthonomonadaceae bacterium]|nr:hypothetical protein [Chthonomonadaceae bacterium]
MKIIGLFQKNKAVPFNQFRDMVRLEVRRNSPGIRVENTENGFIINLDGAPIACNLRNLYAAYCKHPTDRHALITNWMNSLITEVPEHTWVEARMILRPVLKSEENLERARKSLQKAETPDSLPSEPFAGDVSVIIMREVSGTLTGVTQNQLEAWGVSFEEALHEALNNMNMLSFPPIVNVLVAGGSMKDSKGDEVGLVFEGDHMTATWLRMERFRDHLAMRLESDYVVSIPARNRLVAVRADEPGLISSLQMSNRNYYSLPYALTGKLFHVGVATTGGVVTVYQLGSGVGASRPQAAAPKAAESTTFFPNTPAAEPKTLARDLTNYWGLTEPTGENEMSDAGSARRKG